MPLAPNVSLKSSLPPITLGASTKVLVVGWGRFGKHVRMLLKDRAEWLTVDSYEPGPTRIEDGSFDIRPYDIIILAVPIRAYENVIQTIVPRMKKNAIIVDVASVKEHTTKLLEMHAKGRYWIATHPMWGPESYRKTNEHVRGYRLIVSAHTLPRNVHDKLRDIVAAAGIKIVKMTPNHHDGHLAQTLFVAHFFGQVVSFAGLNRTEIDTVSYGYLMSMVESVKDDAELFLDVFRYNRRACSAVLARIEDATHKVRLMIEGVNGT